MWAMSVRRLKRLHERINVHRAQEKLDLLEIICGSNGDENDVQRLQNRIARIIEPMFNKRILDPTTMQPKK